MTAPTATADPAIGVESPCGRSRRRRPPRRSRARRSDDGPTDAGSDKDANKIGMSLPGAERRLADRGDLDIVAQLGRNLEPLGQESGHRQIDRRLAQIRRAEQNAALGIDLTGKPNADSVQVRRSAPLLSPAASSTTCRAGPSSDRPNPRRPSSFWPWPKPRRCQVDHAGENLRSAKIDPECDAHVAHPLACRP